ncbi:NAD(P)-binding protein [Aspergillus japonicus CBS 114.51]|uniref:NAD(P)-binding protein n=2 Tax=Aspergillus TaxID=5052 RepID=A0A2V5HQM5_ASPV1|nr:NAD(P)-binding protein [Aspergillus japonicus CBS 114.51]PYI24424.1 NAD(P)-binding protein [Aspergillus violaceofuscus CBS 115571]RAH81594.1 NAD(P)-binding protein [Aspergillus japonicus CBS 114.51]
MSSHPRSLLVFGASSPTGQQIVAEALRTGWKVTIYGRRTLPIHAQNAEITTLEGTLQDEAQLRRAIQGQPVIVSVLGPSGMTIKDTPFPDFYRRIFRLMREAHVSRILALSTFSVPHARDRFSLPCSLLVGMLRVLGHSAWRNLIEVARAFDEDAEDLEWTLFRVGFLKDQGPGWVVEGYVGDGALGLGVNRCDVARWVVEQAALDQAEHVRDKPGISSA